MDTDSNPYRSPASSSSSVDGVDFVPILRRWERLRIYYNAILISLVLLLTFSRFPQHALHAGYWASVGFGAAVANLCFLTGPAIEAYGTHYRIWSGAMTALLFLAGLGLTTFLAIASIATF